MPLPSGTESHSRTEAEAVQRSWIAALIISTQVNSLLVSTAMCLRADSEPFPLAGEGLPGWVAVCGDE